MYIHIDTFNHNHNLSRVGRIKLVLAWLYLVGLALPWCYHQRKRNFAGPHRSFVRVLLVLWTFKWLFTFSIYAAVGCWRLTSRLRIRVESKAKMLMLLLLDVPLELTEHRPTSLQSSFTLPSNSVRIDHLRQFGGGLVSLLPRKVDFLMLSSPIGWLFVCLWFMKNAFPLAS